MVRAWKLARRWKLEVVDEGAAAAAVEEQQTDATGKERAHVDNAQPHAGGGTLGDGSDAPDEEDLAAAAAVRALVENAAHAGAHNVAL